MFQYKTPGRYVAICNKTNFDGHYTKVFNFPAKATYMFEEEDYIEAGVTASWYFLNRVDGTACLEAVYPIEIFQGVL